MLFRFIFLICFSGFLITASAETLDVYPFTSTHDAARFANLTQTIRCVVCQNQNIADSEAPLANDLREKIYEMIRDHQSDQAIKDYLIKRYGDFILLKPRLTHLTWLLWFGPFLFLGTTLLFFIRFFIRSFFFASHGLDRRSRA